MDCTLGVGAICGVADGAELSGTICGVGLVVAGLLGTIWGVGVGLTCVGSTCGSGVVFCV